MEPETQAQIDQLTEQIKAKTQAEIDAQKAQAKKEAVAEVTAYLKSKFGL
jgi:hypothetical protein